MKSRKSVVWVLSVILASGGTGLASLSDGLVAYYPFSGNANDESGNGHDGTVHGATLTSDHLGNLNSAYSFDGTDDYIRVPDSDELDLTSSFSLAFWLKPGSSNEGMVLSKHVAWTNDDGSWILLRLAGSHPYYPGFLLVENWDSPTGDDVYSQSAAPQDTWTHWAITYDASTHLCTFYRDGEKDATYTYIFDIGNTALDLTIGAGEHRDVPLAYWYEGSVDEVRIYNRALSPDEIRALGVVVPAPGAVVLAGIGAGFVGWLRRRRAL